MFRGLLKKVMFTENKQRRREKKNNIFFQEVLRFLPHRLFVFFILFICWYYTFLKVYYHFTPVVFLPECLVCNINNALRCC